jgi:hypothetical protein
MGVARFPVRLRSEQDPAVSSRRYGERLAVVTLDPWFSFAHRRELEAVVAGLVRDGVREIVVDVTAVRRLGPPALALLGELGSWLEDCEVVVVAGHPGALVALRAQPEAADWRVAATVEDALTLLLRAPVA